MITPPVPATAGLSSRMNPHLRLLTHDVLRNEALSAALRTMPVWERDAACLALLLQRGLKVTELTPRLLGDSLLVQGVSELPGEARGRLEGWSPVSSVDCVWLEGEMDGLHRVLTITALSHDRFQSTDGIYRLGQPRNHAAAQWHAQLHDSRPDLHGRHQSGDECSMICQGGLYPVTVVEYDGPDFIVQRQGQRHSAHGGELFRREQGHVAKITPASFTTEI